VWSPPIPVVLPLVAAAVLAALNRRIEGGWATAVAFLTAAATGGVCLSLGTFARLDPLVYWFGCWAPRRGAALGIGFVVDVPGAGLAMLACLLMAAALLVSARYFDTVGTVYHVLMLVFLGPYAGSALGATCSTCSCFSS